MIRLVKIASFCAAFFVAQFTFAQTAQYPIVKGYGGIYEIPDATERPDPNGEYHIIIDMTTAAADNAEISRWVDNVARMMNLHGIAGVPKDKLHVKVVVHGGAIFTTLNNEEYQKRFNIDNPNTPVYKALMDAGAEIMVCGQSLIAREMKTKNLSEGINVALSALTTFTTYVPQGYTMIKF